MLVRHVRMTARVASVVARMTCLRAAVAWTGGGVGAEAAATATPTATRPMPAHLFSRRLHSSRAPHLLDERTHEAAKAWNIAARLGTRGAILPGLLADTLRGATRRDVQLTAAGDSSRDGDILTLWTHL